MQTYWKGGDQKFLKITQVKVLFLSHEVFALPSCSVGVHRNIKP